MTLHHQRSSGNAVLEDTLRIGWRTPANPDGGHPWSLIQEAGRAQVSSFHQAPSCWLLLVQGPRSQGPVGAAEEGKLTCLRPACCPARLLPTRPHILRLQVNNCPLHKGTGLQGVARSPAHRPKASGRQDGEGQQGRLGSCEGGKSDSGRRARAALGLSCSPRQSVQFKNWL